MQITEFLLDLHSKNPVIIIDEFDQLKSKLEQNKFAACVKEIGDRNLPCKLIFCGIGESIDKFFAAHESAYRQFHAVKLERLAWEPRFEIIMTAADALGITIDETSKIRIARVRRLSALCPPRLREVVLGSLRRFCERHAYKIRPLRARN